MAISKLAMQEIDKVNVLTERVQERRQECRETPSYYSSVASRATTDSWKETEGQPFHLRFAKAFAKVLKDTPATIRDGELIVGSQTKYVRSAAPTAEFDPYPLTEMLEKDSFWTMSSSEPARVEEEDKQIFREDVRYWAGKSAIDAEHIALQEELGDDYLELNSEGVRLFLAHDDQSLPPASFNPRVFKEGLNGIIARAKDELKKIDNLSCQLAQVSSAGYHGIIVLRSIIIACEAVIEFANKHAELARSLAKTESNPERKRELEKIAEHCEWVPANPARTFAEALQSLWFVHLCLKLEHSDHCPSLGRLDQYMYPFYQKDLEEGKITHQEAAELLGCLFVKHNEIEQLYSPKALEIGPASNLQQIVIGGLTKEGTDTTNELSYLILEVTRQMKLREPGIYIRYHNNMSREFLMKAVETNLDFGGGNPAYLNEQGVVQLFLDAGCSADDAVEWIPEGCLTQHMTYVQKSSSEDMGELNLPKVLEITLHNGVDPRTGKLVGLQTGNVTKFTRIEELYEAWVKQVDWFTDKMLKYCFVLHSVKMENCATPFGSAMVEDCITKRLDANEGGERYPSFSVWLGDRGCVDIADSLAAIKRLVFDDKKLTMAELLDVLAVNFEGKEDIRRACLKAPKYGNDDDYVDDIFNWVSLKVQEIMLSKPNPWTGKKPMRVVRPAATGHYHLGEVVGALPNGKKEWIPLNDGALSAMGGADVKGPTALINSATKVAHARHLDGIVLNMKFSPSLLKTQESQEKLLALVKTFFDRGGRHIQFNITSREDLLEAQKHPEQWRSLLVRVAGYSAYFVELPRKVQDEIIARTEHVI